MDGSTGVLDPQIVFALETSPITVTSSLNPSAAGDPVTFTAHVSGSTGGASASRLSSDTTYVPMDFVQFRDNGLDLGSPVPLNLSGSASYITSSLVPGNHAITVHYGGNATWSPGSGTLPGGQTVNGPFPVPSIANLSPKKKPAGSPGFTLTVNGENFTSASTVQWKGANRTTTYVSPTKLTAKIKAKDVKKKGRFNVTVTNPTPGGGVSNAVKFRVT
jgi:hypothetical protein